MISGRCREPVIMAKRRSADQHKHPSVLSYSVSTDAENVASASAAIEFIGQVVAQKSGSGRGVQGTRTAQETSGSRALQYA